MRMKLSPKLPGDDKNGLSVLNEKPIDQLNRNYVVIGVLEHVERDGERIGVMRFRSIEIVCPENSAVEISAAMRCVLDRIYERRTGQMPLEGT